ncbi:MAG: outer membrane lipoprotein carrier protein LolA [Anaeroplasmataceae bacterium]
MKKWFSLLCVLVTMCLVACKKDKSNDTIVTDVCNNIINCSSYKSVATLNNMRDNNKSYTIETVYMKDDYYKVTYNCENAENKQIILRNPDGVYALTPSIAKQFKFESLWPSNGSHIYIPTSVINDYLNDPAKSYVEEDGLLVLTSTINHKIHNNYKYQHITIDKKKESIIGVNYYDENNNVVSSLTFESVVFNVSVNEDDFDASKVINNEINVMGEGSVVDIIGSLEVSYVIEGSSLKTSNESIFVYTGECNYTIVVSDITEDDYIGVSRIYNDFMLCDKGIIFKQENSSTILYHNKEIEIISNNISNENIINIFNSITFI